MRPGHLARPAYTAQFNREKPEPCNPPLTPQFSAQFNREKAELCDPPRRRSVDGGDSQRAALPLLGTRRPARPATWPLGGRSAAQGLALSTDSSARPLAADRCVHAVVYGLRAVKNRISILSFTEFENLTFEPRFACFHLTESSLLVVVLCSF